MAPCGGFQRGNRGGFAMRCTAWLAIAVPMPVAAQVDLHVDAGMGGTRELQGTNVTLAPSFSWTGRWWAVNGSGRYGTRGQAGKGYLGTLDVTGRKEVTPGLAIDAGWSGGKRLLSWGRDGSGWGATVGLSLEHAGRGARLQILRGEAQANVGHVPLSSAEGTAWAQVGVMRIEILGRQTTLGAPVPGLGRPRDSLTTGVGGRPESTSVHQFARFTDLGGAVRTSRGTVSGSFALGHRFSPFGGRNWWRAEALWWMAPRLGLVLGGGQVPPDLILGANAGGYFTLAFRASLADRRPAVRRPASTSGTEGRTLLLARQPDGGTSLAIRAPGTARVELMADFTDWQPVELEPRGSGWFKLTMPVPPGAHYVNLRYDGGRWTPPPGSPTMQDEFGGMVGVVRAE